MMLKVALDSCIFCKLFLDEPDSKDAIELITQLSTQNYQVVVPSLFLYEVLSIASVSQFPLNKTHELLTQYQLANLTVIELDQPIISKAIEICKLGHEKPGFPSFYDASYHALAITNNCQFVTADKRHIAKAKSFGHITLLNNWRSIF